MWVLNAVVIHLLLLGSIFVIYFRSPVVKGLQPRARLREPPAQRLVLIVTDGLRAESFFRNNCNDVPNLRDMMLKNGGLVGVSHTRVPTESRPGHIALIAGLYEDPSAVFRGWKENPIDFDTLFNRSRLAYAFGSYDILHIFEHLVGEGNNLFVDTYSDQLDFSGHNKTYDLDDWVFERVKLLLQRKQEELQKEKHLVFFLHLLGLDTAGHVHKPGSPLFLENLNRTERGIREIYEIFEQTFDDNRTAYVLTSDHGMTDSGSHGSGDPLETDTPFYIWGAGVAAQAPRPADGKTFQVGDDNTRLPLYELEQAQLTPLMAALIGVPPPMNNFGVLPRGYLNVTVEYEARAAHNNAMQLVAQYTELRHKHHCGCFAPYLRQFKKLDELRIEKYSQTLRNLFWRGDDRHYARRWLEENPDISDDVPLLPGQHEHRHHHGELNKRRRHTHGEGRKKLRHIPVEAQERILHHEVLEKSRQRIRCRRLANSNGIDESCPKECYDDIDDYDEEDEIAQHALIANARGKKWMDNYLAEIVLQKIRYQDGESETLIEPAVEVMKKLMAQRMSDADFIDDEPRLVAQLAAERRQITIFAEEQALEFDMELNATLDISYALMTDALEGIDYYHNYYRNALLLCTAATFVGWMCYLLQLLLHHDNVQQESVSKWRLWSVYPYLLELLFGAAGLLLISFLIMQRVALAVSLYLMMPIVVWLMVFYGQRRYAIQMLPPRIVTSQPKSLLVLLLCAELLVFSFFDRRLISVGFCIFAALSGNFRRVVRLSRDGFRYWVWLALIVVLPVFPLLPLSVGYDNLPMLLLGMVMAVLRHHLVTKKFFKYPSYLGSGIAAANALYCAYRHANQAGVWLPSQLISWAFLGFALVTPYIFRSRDLNIRLELIVLLFVWLYALLSTSYELLFLVLLTTELTLSMQLRMADPGDATAEDRVSLNVQKCFRFAFGILLYTFFSFFGSGNIASVSSFDPNVARAFVGTFLPFVIMGLVILKLSLPVIIIIAHHFADEWFGDVHERNIFISLLLICDIMGLNFLFLVRNSGSWLEIGTSISHFVIMQVTTVVVLLLTWVVKLYLGFKLCGYKQAKRTLR